MQRTRIVQGIDVPAFFYGTAWKEERTEALTRQALDAGFRAVDTANQRKHYVEEGVGAAVRAFLAEGKARREDLFLQTKFTYARGQDQRLPYDKKAPVAEQVAQSFASSLEHLGTTYVDAYVLHGPARDDVLAKVDLEAWAAMEKLYDAGKARLLGVSNVNLRQLAVLHRDARIKPAFVQDRTFAQRGWLRPIRTFCSEHGVGFQGFSLLTANQRVVASPEIAAIAARLGKTPAQVVFAFALGVGMFPLTGTSSAEHLRQDLACLDFELGPDDLRAVEALGG